MTIKRANTTIATVLVALWAAAGAAWSEERSEENGRTELRAAQCVACHGVRGVSPNPLFPHLAGQQAGYLQRQLEAFRKGSRYDPLMTPVAQSLSGEDIAALSQHYSRLTLPDAEDSQTAQRN